MRPRYATPLPSHKPCAANGTDPPEAAALDPRRDL
jgi:hypothetical protein